jgi:hypothetical protein
MTPMKPKLQVRLKFYKLAALDHSAYWMLPEDGFE